MLPNGRVRVIQASFPGGRLNPWPVLPRRQFGGVCPAPASPLPILARGP